MPPKFVDKLIMSIDEPRLPAGRPPSGGSLAWGPERDGRPRWVLAETIGPLDHGPGARVLGPNPNRMGLTIQNHKESTGDIYITACSDAIGRRIAGHEITDGATIPASILIEPSESYSFDILPPPFYCYRGPLYVIARKVSDDGEFFFYDGVYTVTELVLEDNGG